MKELKKKASHKNWIQTLPKKKFSFWKCLCEHSNAMKCEKILFNLNDVWMMKWTIWFDVWIDLSQHWTTTFPNRIRLIFHRFTLFFTLLLMFRLNSHHLEKKSACYLFDNKWRKTNRKKMDLVLVWIFFLHCSKWYISKKWLTKTATTKFYMKKTYIRMPTVTKKYAHILRNVCVKKRITQAVNHHWNVSSQTLT